MIFDLHSDTISKLMENENLSLRENDFHIDLMKLKKSSYITQCFAMFVNLKNTKNPYEYVNKMIDRYYLELEKNKDLIYPILKSSDFDYIEKNNLIGSILTIEEGETIEGSIDKLVELYNKGVRLMTLTWNYQNKIGTPNINYLIEPPYFRNKEEGLTEFGIEVVKKMEELNMIIDVSHGSDKLVLDVLKHTKKPFVASHSNANEVCNHLRNLTDDLLIEMKKRGCLVGLNFCKNFVNQKKDLSYVDDLISHIKHLEKIIGIDNIALGTDFDGIGNDLEIKDASYMHLLIERLKENNYSNEEIDKITYLNALNFFKNNL